MSMLFSGFWAMVFAVLGGILLAMGVGLLGRWLLGIPAAVLAAPLRRLGAPGMLAGTGLAANRWRTAALATPIVLVAMLAGTRASSSPATSATPRTSRGCRVQRRTSSSAPTARRCPRAPPPRSRRLDGVTRVTAVVPTEVYPLARGLGDQSPVAGRGPERRRGRRARSTRTWSEGSLADVRGDAVAVSRVFADGGDLRVGDTCRADGRHAARHAARGRRSTTARRGSATCCSIRPSPGATQRTPPTRRCSSPAARPPGRVARALRAPSTRASSR